MAENGWLTLAKAALLAGVMLARRRAAEIEKYLGNHLCGWLIVMTRHYLQ